MLLDLPMQCNQPVAVQENCVQFSTDVFALNEIDLSFYEDLGAGFCSGSASSQVDNIKGSYIPLASI